MNKIIFLDIDGVLNSNKTFAKNHEWNKLFEKVHNGSIEDIVTNKINEIDMEKLFMLRDVCRLTGAKIVISSGWRRLWNYPPVEEKLVYLGLPIIGVTPYIAGNRGEEIREYLRKNKVDEFVILDDEIFRDLNELENYLVKTSFYDDGLTEETAKEIVRVLRRV